MAERKGMAPNTKPTYNDGITFEDPGNTFKAWDYNENNFIDPEEVRQLQVGEGNIVNDGIPEEPGKIVIGGGGKTQ